MTTTLYICDTCKRDNWSADTHDRTDGEVLASHAEAVLGTHPEVKISRHSCLMGCSNACNVALQSEGKITYVLGEFEADAHSAAGIVEFAKLHSQSETGQVPFRQWPQEVKGHFKARIPAQRDDN